VFLKKYFPPSAPHTEQSGAWIKNQLQERNIEYVCVCIRACVYYCTRRTQTSSAELELLELELELHAQFLPTPRGNNGTAQPHLK
jgi:hypothetical protein